ncbi:DUF3098 domain-containing protein [Arsenicibacter rosenii]|uniref:DUF3098 domain-containing protein n=1 Tax=Arsenicibacter rosenii TaxID=1750698 RepID=A0A1S2VLV2_9BACT|nr:DUF3098 domain-containing protein [Arsenicibacter rosenii]OIN59734.1 hypothetical protein BLX24_07695 [Arsenicibacter rosenii]
MAKVSPKGKETTTPEVAESQPVVSRFTSTPKPDKAAALPFGKANYQLMVAGILVILVGFIVMSLDKETFGFGAMGLTVGPLIVMAGFIIEFFAILKKPNQA